MSLCPFVANTSHNRQRRCWIWLVLGIFGHLFRQNSESPYTRLSSLLDWNLDWTCSNHVMLRSLYFLVHTPSPSFCCIFSPFRPSHICLQIQNHVPPRTPTYSCQNLLPRNFSWRAWHFLSVFRDHFSSNWECSGLGQHRTLDYSTPIFYYL